MLSSLSSSGRARANGVTAGLTNIRQSRRRPTPRTRQPFRTNAAPASAGAYADCAGNPDRPARRQVLRTAAIAASPTRSRGAWRWENESNRRDGEHPDVELGRGERGIADDSGESGANGEGQAGRPLRRGKAQVPSSAEREGKPAADWLRKAGGDVSWGGGCRATTSLPPPSLSQSSRAGSWRSSRRPRTHSGARASPSERRRDRRSRASSRTSRRPWRCG
jgi:hypothetical protein